MQTKIAQLREQVEAEIASVATEQQLEEFRIKFLSRKGLIAQLFDELKTVPASDKPLVGKQLNELRQRTQSLFDGKAASLKSKPKATAQLDSTLPGRRKFRGTKHPLMQTLDEIKSIFVSMGFGIADGPEIEDDWHNFGALNFPPDHPARDMQDTFFVSNDILLRTHTSSVQIRVMENNKPPIRSIMPGRAYRNEAVSTRSLCNFYQVEGLAVDKGITFSELKGTLLSFARQFYGKDIGSPSLRDKYRFRPSFFPFTEPSAEMDIACFICKGKGCRLCKHSGWLEILGCGMVDPNGFTSVGYDAEQYTGYAFGMGIERTAALLYGVDDIRLFYENDVRFLRQF